MKFANRREAGRILGASLARYALRPDVVVLALPRGGVPVGYEVARVLEAPLGIFIVRKVAAPGEEELAMGAVASGGVVLIDEDVVEALAVTREQLDRAIQRELDEVTRREMDYGSSGSTLSVSGRTAILVDDGLSTGGPMRAAARAVRRLDPARVIAAVPIASRAACLELQGEVDEVACLATPAPFFTVGMWYSDFTQVSDSEARTLLLQAGEERDATVLTGGMS